MIFLEQGSEAPSLPAWQRESVCLAACMPADECPLLCLYTSVRRTSTFLKKYLVSMYVSRTVSGSQPYRPDAIVSTDPREKKRSSGSGSSRCLCLWSEICLLPAGRGCLPVGAAHCILLLLLLLLLWAALTARKVRLDWLDSHFYMDRIVAIDMIAKEITFPSPCESFSCVSCLETIYFSFIYFLTFDKTFFFLVIIWSTSAAITSRHTTKTAKKSK